MSSRSVFTAHSCLWFRLEIAMPSAQTSFVPNYFCFPDCSSITCGSPPAARSGARRRGADRAAAPAVEPARRRPPGDAADALPPPGDAPARAATRRRSGHRRQPTQPLPAAAPGERDAAERVMSGRVEKRAEVDRPTEYDTGEGVSWKGRDTASLRVKWSVILSTV